MPRGRASCTATSSRATSCSCPSDARAPLKAVDFGLAAFFDPSDPKPREDLGLEGTPWYMAPEVLSSKVGPEADLWAAGVMAFQLLTGQVPVRRQGWVWVRGGPRAVEGVEVDPD